MGTFKIFKLLIVTTVILILIYLLSLIQQPISVYFKNTQMDSKLIKDDFVTTNYNYIAIVKDYIEQETADYQFPKNFSLKRYLATGGKPLHNIIVTTWRTGSTFLGEILNAVPGNFYHYEPLLQHSCNEIRFNGDLGVNKIKLLFNCDYKNLNSYINKSKVVSEFFKRNTRLWNICELYPKYCFDPTFLHEVCKLFPFQSMKVIKLRLQSAEQLLSDKSLNVRIVFLIRDPRGIYQSRKPMCPQIRCCVHVNTLCEDMVSDYKAAVKLMKLYPTRFRVIRYEDLTGDLNKQVKELFDFLQLSFHSSVKAFFDSHTKFQSGGLYSTFRTTNTTPYRWRTIMNFSEVQFIENNCDRAMKLWGYVKAYNETNLRKFNPVTSYTIN